MTTAPQGDRRLLETDIAQRLLPRFVGEQGGRDYVAGAEHPDTRMARIALDPSWVGVLDNVTRTPEVMGSGEDAR